jgi:hypothetical protein
MNNVINTFCIRAFVELVVWTEIFMKISIMEKIPLLRDNTNRYLTWGVSYYGYYRVLKFVSRKQFRKATTDVLFIIVTK